MFEIEFLWLYIPLYIISTVTFVLFLRCVGVGNNIGCGTYCLMSLSFIVSLATSFFTGIAINEGIDDMGLVEMIPTAIMIVLLISACHSETDFIKGMLRLLLCSIIVLGCFALLIFCLASIDDSSSTLCIAGIAVSLTVGGLSIKFYIDSKE